MATKWTVSDNFNFGEEVSEGANGGGFASTAIAHDHHPTDFRIDDVEQQGELHLFLSDHGGERKYRSSCRWFNGSCYQGFLSFVSINVAL
jgi:hypothetical protein